MAGETNEFFDPWEGEEITSWQGFVDRLNDIQSKTEGRSLVWRGVANAEWALHSGLARATLARFGELTEDKQVELESLYIGIARAEWRFENLSALEILAQLQHYEAPTRLLDVSYNPLVSLWFAVEKKILPKDEEADGRLFAFEVADPVSTQTSLAAGHDLPWKHDSLGATVGDTKVWKPSGYNARIAAQNAAFLIGAVPKTVPGKQYRKAPGDGTKAGLWKLPEVQGATSIPLKMVTNDKAPQKGSTNYCLTFRIGASAKEEIRARLNDNFGYAPNTIYPDLYGLAEYLRKHKSGPA